MRTTSLSRILLLGLVGGTVIGLGAFPYMKPKWDYWAGYKVGAAEADNELKAGRASIYVYGLRPASENQDQETGLPYQGIAGCLVDERIVGRAVGHNERIAEYIKEHGLPSNSSKGEFQTRVRPTFDVRRF
jgi:hypothetical protein